MKVTELRIGNLVTLDDKMRKECWENQIHAHNDFFEVKTIYSDGDVSLQLDDEIIELSEDEIDPIPLTEEWLLKAGFEKINHINGYSFFYYKRKRNSNMTSISIYDSHTTIGNTSTIPHCEYIHQLQNLYFTLTQKELTFK